jgi:hypothetical protein
MLRELSGAAIVGSLAFALACSSSSSPVTDESDAASQGGEDSGAHDAGSNGQGDTSTATCDDPLQQIATITGKTVPAACKTCVDSSCSSSVDACATSSCLSCGPGVYECAMSSCSASCFATADSGAPKPGDSGASSDAADACATLSSCSGCALVNVTMPGSMATCMSAITSDQTAVCQGYLSGIHAVSPTTCQ